MTINNQINYSFGTGYDTPGSPFAYIFRLAELQLTDIARKVNGR